jgi:hypothetical protein
MCFELQAASVVKARVIRDTQTQAAVEWNTREGRAGVALVVPSEVSDVFHRDPAEARLLERKWSAEAPEEWME